MLALRSTASGVRQWLRQPILPRRAPVVTRTFYTRGDALLTPVEYRRSFETDLQRSLSGTVNVSDETAARAYAVASTAHACTEKRAMYTGGIPLRVVDSNHEPIDDSELSYFQSNPALILASMCRSLIIWGRYYLRKRYNQQGYPTGLEWIHPQRVREMPDQDGNVAFYAIRQITYWGMGGEEQVPAEQVVYNQLFDTDPNGIGMSKFEACFRDIGVQSGIVTHAAAFFVNNAAIDGMLTFDTPLSSDAEYAEARKQWQVFKGAKNAHRTAVMPAGARWTAISAPPKDLAMGELDDKSVKKIHAVIDIDPSLTGMEATSDPLGASSTYQTKEVAHIRNVAIPFATMYILSALNDQWAATDFSQPYTLEVDTAKIAAFNDANLLKSDTVVALTGAGVQDYDEGRELLGMPARGEQYLKRDVAQASQLWNDMAITLRQYLQLVGAPPSPLPMDMMNISGVGLVPVTEVPTIWQKRILIAPSVYNSEIITGEPLPQPVDPNTVIPTTGAEQPAEVAKEQGVLPGNSPATPTLPATVSSEPLRATSEGYAILSLANDGQIKQLQDEVKAQVKSINGIEWTPPEEFHITLVCADPIDDRQFQRVIGAIENNPPSQMKFDVIALSSFDGDGKVKPLILEVKLSDELKALQTELAVRVKATGAKLSEYSEPNAYKPHITLAYVPSDMSNPELPSEIIVTPSEIVFSRDDYKPIETIEFEPSILTVASRAAQPLELALSFAGNAFIRYCRRALSEALTSQGVTAQWVSEDDWRLTLARAEQWTPAAAANIIKASNYADTRPLDFTTAGFERIGNTILLTLTGDLAGLQRSAGLDLEGANLTPLDADFPGVEMCRLEGTPTLPTSEKYPLVGNVVTLLKGNEPLHTWTLTGVSAARSKELQHWRSVAKDGRNFTPDVLRDSDVAAFITDALAADVPIDDVFELARDMLRGLVVWRAYPETRKDFVDEITTLFYAAQADETTRRAFAARLRTLLNRFGLLAFHDGMAEAGNDHDSLSADELATFKGWRDEQSGYVTNFGAEIFKEGVSELEIAQRIYMWTDVSLGRVKILGTIAGGDPMLRRVLGQVESEHCPECHKLAGQVHKASEWAKRDLLIGSSLTTCKQGCHCSFEVTNEDESGDWL